MLSLPFRVCNPYRVAIDDLPNANLREHFERAHEFIGKVDSPVI